MNVAITRAKRLCVLIGDSGTVSKNSFLKSLVEYFKAYGVVRTGFDYLGNEEVRQGYGQKG
jgi:superfamily I DNA and/or RNA helicase